MHRLRLKVSKGRTGLGYSTEETSKTTQSKGLVDDHFVIGPTQLGTQQEPRETLEIPQKEISLDPPLEKDFGLLSLFHPDKPPDEASSMALSSL